MIMRNTLFLNKVKLPSLAVNTIVDNSPTQQHYQHEKHGFVYSFHYLEDSLIACNLLFMLFSPLAALLQIIHQDVFSFLVLQVLFYLQINTFFIIFFMLFLISRKIFLSFSQRQKTVS